MGLHYSPVEPFFHLQAAAKFSRCLSDKLGLCKKNLLVWSFYISAWTPVEQFHKMSYHAHTTKKKKKVSRKHIT